MGAIAHRTLPLGDGTVLIYARTTGGNEISLVVGQNLVGKPETQAMLDLRATAVDNRAAALDSRLGKSEHDL